MEFGFRAGDRSPSRDRRFTPPLAASERPRSRAAGPFHGEPPPSPFEWEAAALRERIIREEVERRLIEDEVRRERAVARARFHGGFGPVTFVGPDGSTIVPPPPPQGPFFMPDGPSTPPMPLQVGMRPNCPPPAFFGPWDGFGPRRLSGFGQPMLPIETRTRPLPPPKPRHQLQLQEIAPSSSSEVISSGTKASGVKRKAGASATSATTKPTKLQNASSAITRQTKLQNTAIDWSCALCQVSATSEAGLSQHLEGKKHKAKLVQCGATKVNHTNKSGLQVTTRNNSGAGPSDATKKIHILVDGEMHQAVQKSNCVWCERCRVSCTNAAAMADHLLGKKHSLLNKDWMSIKAVRMKEAKEDSAARKVNENGSTGILEEYKEEDTYMTSEFSVDGSFEIPMEMKETTVMAEEIDADSRNVVPVEIKKEYTDTASKLNRNFLLKVHRISRKKANKKFLSKVHQKSRKKAIKKFLLKVHHQKS